MRQPDCTIEVATPHNLQQSSTILFIAISPSSHLVLSPSNGTETADGDTMEPMALTPKDPIYGFSNLCQLYEKEQILSTRVATRCHFFEIVEKRPTSMIIAARLSLDALPGSSKPTSGSAVTGFRPRRSIRRLSCASHLSPTNRIRLHRLFHEIRDVLRKFIADQHFSFV